MRTPIIRLILGVGMSLGFLVTAAQTALALTSPAPGSSVSVAMATFDWTAGDSAVEVWGLNIGMSAEEGCNSDRFKCLMPTMAFPTGEAVLDRQTGQVWDRAPHDTRHATDMDADAKQTWSSASHHCANRMIGGQKGRLPSFAELESLVEGNNRTGNTFLPAGHPFIGLHSFSYWSASSVGVATSTRSYAIGMRFMTGEGIVLDKTEDVFVWCIRSGDHKR